MSSVCGPVLKISVNIKQNLAWHPPPNYIYHGTKVILEFLFFESIISSAPSRIFLIPRNLNTHGHRNPKNVNITHGRSPAPFASLSTETDPL